MPSQNIPAFDLCKTPLEGSNLIEASAGTGKTYAIASLVVRLLLEKGFSIQQILVVTFTDAATAELRDRVLKRLRDTQAAFQGIETEDPTLLYWLTHVEDKNLALAALDNAIRGFDEAPIFTIHGFCKRLLQDNAFETGVLFNTELLRDESGLLHEVAADFWRSHFYTAEAEFLEYAVNSGHDLDYFVKFLKNYLSKPFLTVIPPSQPSQSVTQLADKQAEFQQQLADKQTEFQQQVETLRLEWQTSADDVRDILLNDDSGLSRKSYAKKSIPKWIEALEEWMSTASIPLFKHFGKFCADEFKYNTVHNPLQHAFFDICIHVRDTAEVINQYYEKLHDAAEAINQHYAQCLINLKHQLLKKAKVSLQQRKRQQNVQSFDDLLQNVHKALKSAGKQTLIEAMRKQYRAALIDEFQDTDPLQYDIFQQIFSIDNADNTPLFLIGDPKQAIYSFRGADIFAYLRAANDATQRYTLGTNWRSSPPLISAVNYLFSQNDTPFLQADIQFQAVQSAEKNKALTAHIPALDIVYCPRDLAKISKKIKNKKTKEKDEGLITKGSVESLIPEWVATRIVAWLNQENGVQANDIAVLVSKNKQAQDIQNALRKRAVPSVIYSRGSVFQTAEAEQLRYVLAAMLEPSNEKRLRTALSTDLLGLNASDLYQLQADEIKWSQWLEKNRDWHDRWRVSGFMPMFRQWLKDEQIPTRLLAYHDGERRLSNILHLAELLQKAALSSRRDMQRLYKWYTQQCQQPDPNADDHLLRLESDAQAVKLVTIHYSKGLEYAYVIIPYAWDGGIGGKKEKQVMFHDPDHAQRLTVDIGSTEFKAHRQRAQWEEKAEKCRLFYVAITRAKVHCSLFWGAFNDAQNSILCDLLHDDIKLNDTDDETLFKQLEQHTEAEDISITYVAPANNDLYQAKKVIAPQLKARVFRAKIPNTWRLASFTALIKAQHTIDTRQQKTGEIDPEIPAKIDNNITPLDATPSAFTFPKGATAGNALHDILEHLDFQEQRSGQRHILINNALQKQGIDTVWTDTVDTWLQAVLHAPLDPNLPELCLAQLTSSNRLNELEFHYPLKSLQAHQLNRVLQQFYPDREIMPDFGYLQGFMRGFVDLIFEYQGRYYLTDYKSNFLGNTHSDYQPDQLNQAMQTHHYYLQYSIYSVALHRYLKIRLADYDYDKHFGGVYYLFLRGMQPDQTTGVFRDHPSKAFIEALSAQLSG